MVRENNSMRWSPNTWAGQLEDVKATHFLDPHEFTLRDGIYLSANRVRGGRVVAYDYRGVAECVRSVPDISRDAAAAAFFSAVDGAAHDTHLTLFARKPTGSKVSLFSLLRDNLMRLSIGRALPVSDSSNRWGEIAKTVQSIRHAYQDIDDRLLGYLGTAYRRANG